MTATILVVEDEVIIGMDIKNSLKKLGYHVPAVIATGEKAIEKAEKIQPDLILMDIMLKGSMDGVEAADKIRHLFNLPVVFLTAHTDAKTLERAKGAQPFGYIVKPFQEKDLHTTVEIALARCKAETEIRKALEKEKELNELKTRFVSMVSHEFRTPMSTILFSSDLLEMYLDEWSREKKLTHVHRIQSAIQRMIEMLDEILVIGKAEAGKLEFNPSPINLQKFCKELVEDIEVFDREKHPVEVNMKCNCNEAIMDEKLLRHILSNLLSNAVKYSPDNSPIFFSATCENNEVLFEIKDLGIGIPIESQKSLFETFYRAPNVGTIPGTGLGLAIVKKSVELHGGTIAVQSEVGVGTTFTVKLPMR
ncbi:response regulator [Planktothrix sp. FACHB-1355]|uniref:histidine kinase n=1 Tax=Aerosakkonema funiforme FACHB-1375 TaxID=2949571 RepID=A0A926VM56_9CYAN|nr:MULTISPECIES: ATP-binding protein [Oscillatoriales]MBD2186274.1 response regulator [Aerosakkonema funiforme FACHB-1375]MBD3558332.1 response regulator [Planktothrix sp. FACHB-1355]